MKAYLLLVFLLVNSVRLSAQPLDFDVLDVTWTDKIDDGQIGLRLSERCQDRAPILWLKIKGDTSLYNKINEIRAFPVRFKWLVRGGLSLSRRRSLKPTINGKFNDEFMIHLKQQLDQNGHFTLEFWSKSFKRIRSGDVNVSLVYEDNSFVDKCLGERCKFKITVH